MTAKQFHSICQLIAQKLNQDKRAQNGVTPEQVALVASGQERTVSHPIIAAIMRELREEGVAL